MTSPAILAALNTFQQAANRGTAVHLSPELVQELRDALKTEPEADEGDDAIDRWIESRPDWPNDWPGVTQSQLTALIGEALEHWGRPATPPAPETPAEALAARPLLEQVAAMADCIGAQTVGQIAAISNRAAAWLRANPPGQPRAIEPRGCPMPGACSCVEPAPPATKPGEVQPPHPTFLDAIRLAQGCRDYSGGHSGPFEEAFQDGVGTVVAVLKKAAVGPWDSQTMAVFGVGSAPQAGEVQS